MESVRRGDIVSVAIQGDFGKPRPAVVIQSDLYNPTHPSITVLPITSDLRDTPQFRVTLEPSEQNGLQKISQIMVDKPMTFLRDKIGDTFGTCDDETMVRVNRSLAVWLGIV